VNQADPAPILDLIEAFRRSKTMFCAVKLGVFDLLQAGALSAAAVAKASGTDPSATERLLFACVSLKLLDEESGQFRNTEAASTYLYRDSATSMAGYILYSNDVLFQLWDHLDDAVREGTHRWNQSFGFSGPLFDSFFPTDEAMRTFIMGMHGFGTLSSPSVAQAFDLSQFKIAADLGGATGHLTVALCERNANLRGLVFDFPRVLRVAEEQIAQSAARDRIQCVPGDFFRDPLPAADLYIMGRILHDWNEVKVDELVHKAYKALPPGGALLLAEKLLDDDHHGPISGQMQSLNMLICTEGRERSLAEYATLLRCAGFAKVDAVRTGKPVDAILARKA
jgi:acetylserotonin N-methyltransferase